MTEKITKTVGSFSLDKEGAKKILKSFIISAVGAAVVGLGDLVNVINLGSWQSLLVAFAPFVVNTLKLWLGKYESKVN